VIEKELLKKSLYASSPPKRTMAPLSIVVSAVTDCSMEWLVGKYIVIVTIVPITNIAAIRRKMMFIYYWC
jgi:hypothetical protein